MCLDEYLADTIVRQRHAEAHAWAARQALLANIGTPWQVSLGRQLVRLGERLVATGAPSRIQHSLS